MTSGLRRFASASAAPPAPDGDRCGLCGEQLPPEHAHLVDIQERSIGCACRACALLFTREGGRYRTIPNRVLQEPGSQLTEAEWDSLRIPVAIAFFFTNSDLGRVVASYPSPAGVTECELDLAAWEGLAAAHPLLREAAPDIEAILMIRGQPGTSDDLGIETFLVPIDVCYQLAGALRLHWRGFDGGSQVRRLLHDILEDLRGRAKCLT
jgi:hypothetical protein